MTKDEVLKLAIKSGLIKRHDCEEWLCNTGNIETFAKLIEETLKQLNTEETL